MKRARMVILGVRLALGGGRRGVVRILLVASGVAVGTALLIGAACMGLELMVFSHTSFLSMQAGPCSFSVSSTVTASSKPRSESNGGATCCKVAATLLNRSEAICPSGF